MFENRSPRYPAASPHARLRIWTRISCTLLAIALWELLARTLETRPESFPAPSRVIIEIISSATDLQDHGLFTLTNILSGYLLGTCCTLPLAALAFQVPPLGRALFPVLVSPARLLLPLLIPLFSAWLGMGASAGALVAFLLTLFTAGAAFLRGFYSIPAEVNELVRSMGAASVHTFFQVRLPASLPCGFCGMKEAVYFAVLGVTVVEFAEGDRGLGYLMLSAALRLETPAILAALAVLLSGCLLLRGFIQLIELAILSRHIPQGGKPGLCGIGPCPRITCR